MNPRQKTKPPKPRGTYNEILTESQRKKEVRSKQVKIDMDIALAKAPGRVSMKKKVKF
jgi:hypothetical protein